MADVWVLNSQKWLNARYAGVSGFTKVVEDGVTGWSTMFGLTRALQSELGISALSDNFGAGTMDAFTKKVGSISSSTGNENIVGLLQCALWCKGYTGGTDIGKWADVVAASVANVRSDLGLTTASTVDVKLMKSLLTLDAYIRVGQGTDLIRAAQQWLNAGYAHRGDFTLIPCDGTYTRDVQRGLMLAIQYEIGMADGVANGNFGPGTQSGLRSVGKVASGSADASTKFVSLFQVALAFNGYEVSRTGVFTAATRTATLDFQRFLEITATGDGDYDTWAALLVSTGNPDRPVTGMDTTTALTTTVARARFAEGYRVVGRYLTVTGKAIAPGELDIIFDSGMAVVPIFQNFNNGPQYFTRALGLDHGRQAAIRARQLGFTGGTTIFFAVDYDAFASEIDNLIKPYFEGVAAGLAASTSERYGIGIYATRNIASEMLRRGLVSAVWVSGMSTGYSGNLGYPMPENWSYNQIQEVSAINIDRDAVSVRARPARRADVDRTPDSDDATRTFYWNMVRQLVLAEESIRGHGLVSPAVASDCVLSFLMSRHYTDSFWPLYGPAPEAVVGLSASTVEQIVLARNAYMGNSGSIDDAILGYPGDAEHMAATARAAQLWGLSAMTSTPSAGDLGGWALDLVTLWRSYRQSGSKDPSAFVEGNLGVKGSSGTFDEADLIADADGWLVARDLRSGLSLEQSLRGLFIGNAKWQSRLTLFLAGRFGDQAGLEAAVESLFFDYWPWSFGSRELFLNGLPGPTATEMQAFRSAVGRQLYSIAR